MKKLYQWFLPALAGMGLLWAIPASAQLTVSGQLRTRSELLDGQGTLATKTDRAAFFTSQRTRLGVNYKAYRMQLQVTAQDVRVWGQDASTNNRLTNSTLNGLMLHEAWAEIALLDTAQARAGKELNLKIGRQELLYDDSRLLGNLDWLQQARRHDAVVLKYTAKGFMAHLGAAYNQNRELKAGGLYEGIPNGYPAGTNGIGTMYKSMQYLYLGKKLPTGTASFLVFKDDFQKYTLASTGERTLQRGTWNRVTLGPYLQLTAAKRWNLSASAYYQSGHDKDGKDLNAFMYSARGLYNVSKHFAIGPGFDYTSGSKGSSTGNHTFDPLYGTPHKFWGQMDYFYAANGFGKGGLQDLYLNTVVRFSDKLNLQTDVHHFSSATELRDAQDQRRSSNFGNEVDVIANYTLTKAIGFQAGYCTSFSTSSLAMVKNVANPAATQHWAYLMLNIRPEFLFKNI